LDCTALKDARLPKALTVGYGAFRNAASLSTVNLPLAQEIGGRAFQNCTSLTILELPGVQTLGEYAFEKCGLTRADFKAVTDVGEYAFYQCAALNTLSLPAATKIGNYAFRGCTALITLNLEAVTSLGESAFLETGTKALSITMPRIAPAYSSNNQASAKYAKAVRLIRPEKNIRNSTTYDEQWREAFGWSFGGSASVTLGSNQEFFTLPLTSAAVAERYLAAAPATSLDKPMPLPLQMYLAGGADDLQKVFSAMHVNQNYVDLDLSRCTSNNNVFNTNAKEGTGKDQVVSLVLPNTAWGIRDDSPDDPYDYPVFNHFNNLKFVSGAGITYIGMNAFMDRTTLETAGFPKAERVSDRAFFNCSKLTAVNLASAKWLGTSAFENCSTPFDLHAPNLTDISGGGSTTFKNSGLKEAKFPYVTQLGYAVFYGCKSLTNINMPLLSTIPNETFAHCEALTEVTNMYDNVRFIGDNAFWGCISLTRVLFPHVDNGGLGHYVFARCTSLTYVDLGFYEPLDARIGLFWEAGTNMDEETTLTIKLNELEDGNMPRDMSQSEIPAGKDFRKYVKIENSPNAHQTWYKANKGWRRVFHAWFGSGARLTVEFAPGVLW
jgi:hypothetical protein